MLIELLARVRVLGDKVLVSSDGLLLAIKVARDGKLRVETILGREGRLLLVLSFGGVGGETVLLLVVRDVLLGDLVGLVVHLAPGGDGGCHGEGKIPRGVQR